jgi:hypothetical protein
MNSGAAIGAPGGPAAGIVVMNNFDKNIRAFDRATGKLVWTHKAGGPSGGSATIAGSTVYIGSWDRNFYALDAHTGAPRLLPSLARSLRSYRLRGRRQREVDICSRGGDRVAPCLRRRHRLHDGRGVPRALCDQREHGITGSRRPEGHYLRRTLLSPYYILYG